MNSVRAIQQLNKRELEAGVGTEGSWHTDYRDTAFINIGGLPFELSEGDIITIFSQYGEPVWVKLARDKETGKSRGFAWIKYEDQRSCDLAVDNLGGSTIMDRVIRVDHARYKPMDGEDMRDNTMGEPVDDDDQGSDDGRRKRRKTDSESDSDEDRPLLPEEIELDKLMDKLDEDDPMRDSMIKRQQEKVDEALKKLKKAKRKEKERAKRREKHHHKDGSRDRHREKERRKIKDDEEDGGHVTEKVATGTRTMTVDSESQGIAMSLIVETMRNVVIAVASVTVFTATRSKEVDVLQSPTMIAGIARVRSALLYHIERAHLVEIATMHAIDHHSPCTNDYPAFLCVKHIIKIPIVSSIPVSIFREPWKSKFITST
ncbi:hypothetical protein SNOG_03018 [Parastagonospora nodorum SN15]|uniref:RRM domain-containing protein n=1 Tax=Phaeosphaeria nodorum (strain SN15 / ATCC MYA-4574 / FGSC 10173) TaxID=321614 RepID=Q0UYZ6_PHANO|nr:hypothetical protein SNOG_03018 [Parastagonospora nodorum SN15]EAT89749.2 hypothetical protein SNOG_03018 [Parastagonospora nodorum SN15]